MRPAYNPLVTQTLLVASITLAVAAVLLWVVSRLMIVPHRRWARKAGAALPPLSVRLLPLVEPVSPALARHIEELAAAGYREVGRWTTDRAPIARLIGLVAPDGGHAAIAIEHPTLGTYIGLSRSGENGDEATVLSVRLPAQKRPPWMTVVCLPGADVARLAAELARIPSASPPVDHGAVAFAAEYERAYRRAMEWMYTEGSLKDLDPDALARNSGVEVDAETAYFLRVRREERARATGVDSLL